MPAVAAGEVAPPFELTGADGKPYSLESALAQGPLLAAFFKVSCPTCQYTLPFLDRLYQQLRDKGAQVWGISQDDSRDSQRFAKEFGVTFPILIDDEPYETSRRYGLTYVPTIFLVGPDRHVEMSFDGFSKADLVEAHRWLAKELGGTPGELFRPSEKIPEYKPG